MHVMHNDCFMSAKSSLWTIIWYKLYNLHGKAPSYLIDCCTPISDVASWRRRYLRSASCHQLLIPRHNISTYGRRAFSVAGPAAWNCLSDVLREPLLTVNSFRQLLVRSNAYLPGWWHPSRLRRQLTIPSVFSGNMCAVQRMLNSFRDRSFVTLCPRIWNSLPRGLRTLDISY